MSEKFGVGIRGTGQVAIEHLKAIEANAHTAVVAVCGSSLKSGVVFRYSTLG